MSRLRIIVMEISHGDGTLLVAAVLSQSCPNCHPQLTLSDVREGASMRKVIKYSEVTAFYVVIGGVVIGNVLLFVR